MTTLLGGCVIDTDGTPNPQPDPVNPIALTPPDNSTRGYLARPRKLAVQPGGLAYVTAKRLWGEDRILESVVPFQRGEIVVQAQPDGRLTVVSAELVVGDVHLPPESVPPTGLDLTGVTLHLNTVTAATRWTPDGESAAANVQTELILDWSLRADTATVLPMATQHIREVPLTLQVIAGKDGRLHAVVTASRAGTFFTWTGLFELSDLELSLDAAE